MTKTNFFTETFLLYNNNNTTNFHLHLQFFAHAALIKAGPGVQTIFNIIIVPGSADVDAFANERWFSSAEVDATQQMWTQSSRIGTSLIIKYFS